MAVLEEEVSSMPENGEIEWSVENEVQLLLALIGHKPVGISKYFHMACILNKFSEAIHRDDISSKTIWDRLDTMYDMQALEETELVPFPNEQKDFSLPKSQYGALVEQKISVSLPSVSDDSDDEPESASKTASTKGRKEQIKKEETKKVTEEPKRKGPQDKKELRGTKRGARDDDDQSGNAPSSVKRSRESSDVEDTPVTTQPSKRTSAPASNIVASNKGKRPTRLSIGKTEDVSSPPAKRRRN